jgi:hypothetical protein
MRVFLILILCGGLIAGTALLFATAFEMRAVEAKVSAMSRSIDAIDTRARMLEVEWAMLNRREHLQQLLAAVEEQGLMQTLTPIRGEQLIAGVGVIMHRLPPGQPLPEWPLPVTRGKEPTSRSKSAPARQQTAPLPAAPLPEAPLGTTDAPIPPASAARGPEPMLAPESVLAALEVDP